MYIYVCIYGFPCNILLIGISSFGGFQTNCYGLVNLSAWCKQCVSHLPPNFFLLAK